MPRTRGIGRIKPGVVVCLLASLAVPSWSRPALAWGRVGHRTCGKLTDMLLTPKARNEIRNLLEEGESLADASTWADENRDLDRGSATWHYVNVPILSASAYDPKFCSNGGCVVSKIAEYRRILSDRNRPREARRKALRYLVHFVQDLHQPLHVGDNRDKGGNDLQLTFRGRPWNLHAVWDSGLLSAVDRNEDRHLARLRRKLTPELEKAWSSGKVEDWATESLLAAKTAYRDPKGGALLRSGDRIDDAYVQANAELLDKRLSQAGVRLAWILNDVFK